MNGTNIREEEKSTSFNISYQALYILLKNAYKEGFNTFEMVEAGLEPYNPDGYSDWIVKTISKYDNKTV